MVSPGDQFKMYLRTIVGGEIFKNIFIRGTFSFVSY